MIDVKEEPSEVRQSFYSTERCCFCREPTRYWTDLPNRSAGQQVACCRSCACAANAADVPTKSAWFRREEIADHSFGNVARMSEAKAGFR